VTRWENREARVRDEMLVARLHVDLLRVSSAACPRG
jgi:hypothetical protein